MATYLADRVIVFEGTPAIEATATPYVPCRAMLQKLIMISFRPQSLLTGMNKFLASLEITFRRDPTNYRPRVNKAESVKDREQKGKLHMAPKEISLTINYSGGHVFLPRAGLIYVAFETWK